MRFEIMKIVFPKLLNGHRVYRYDCFIDNVMIEAHIFNDEQEPFKVYQYFIKLLVREWKTKYKRKYDKELGNNHKERYGDV